MAENYSLSWEGFPDHLQLMLRELLESEKFADLTLVCEDQTQFRAHQSVLSVSSPVLQRIIENCPSQHPLIYLRGIQSQEIQAVLQFIYTGEAEVSQERMGEFIRVANDLEVKEIKDNMTLPPVDDQSDEETIVENKEKEKKENIRYCILCEYQTHARTSLLSHIKSVHEAVRFPCDHCSYEGTTASNLRSHIIAKHETEPLRCKDCDFTTRWRQALYTHKKSHDQVGGFKYPCAQCEYKATSETSLQKHIQNTHNGYNGYACDQCDFKGTTKSILKEHSHTTHNGPLFHCDECDFKGTAKASLQKHVNSNHPLVYPCDYCEYQAATKMVLHKHILCDHEDKSYKCEKCDYQTVEKKKLVNHMPKHDKQLITTLHKKYYCDQCEYQSTTRNSLKIHIESKHEGIKYPCSHCRTEFRCRSDLKRHIRSIHLAIKFNCKQCDYQSKDQTAVKRHVQTAHEGVRYRCDQCEYTTTIKKILRIYIQSSYHKNLRSHIQGIHEKRILKCEFCNFQTKWDPEYYGHRKTHLVEKNVKTE